MILSLSHTSQKGGGSHLKVSFPKLMTPAVWSLLPCLPLPHPFLKRPDFSKLCMPTMWHIPAGQKYICSFAVHSFRNLPHCYPGCWSSASLICGTPQCLSTHYNPTCASRHTRISLLINTERHKTLCHIMNPNLKVLFSHLIGQITGYEVKYASIKMAGLRSGWLNVANTKTQTDFQVKQKKKVKLFFLLSYCFEWFDSHMLTKVCKLGVKSYYWLHNAFKCTSQSSQAQGWI